MKFQNLLFISCLLASFVFVPSNSYAETNSGQAINSAILAGGCFWCMESAFEKLPGVLSVTSGYVGGSAETATYKLVSAGRSEHAEAVKVEFDPKKLSYTQVLNHFWKNIDPFAVNRQFCDKGKQYRSGIFYQSEQEKTLALKSKEKIVSEFQFQQSIATEITKATDFYPAEKYHQDYYKKNPMQYKSYYLGCGRARRLKEIWGAK